MPERDESDLRALLRSADAPNTLDADRIIGRSRTRRRTRSAVAGAGSALAFAAVLVLAVQTSQFGATPAASTAGGGDLAESSDASTPMMESGPGIAYDQDAGGLVKRAPADKVNLCAGTLAELGGSSYGLQLDVDFPDAATTGTGPVEGTVLLTNTSGTRVTGYTAATPALTLSQDGTVLWHSNGVMIQVAVEVDLEPGESLEYPASFTPVQCGVEDDLGDFRADLPAVPAGRYQLSAVMDFQPDASMGQPETAETDLVSGPISAITLE